MRRSSSCYGAKRRVEYVAVITNHLVARIRKCEDASRAYGESQVSARPKPHRIAKVPSHSGKTKVVAFSLLYGMALVYEGASQK